MTVTCAVEEARSNSTICWLAVASAPRVEREVAAARIAPQPRGGESLAPSTTNPSSVPQETRPDDETAVSVAEGGVWTVSERA